MVVALRTRQLGKNGPQVPALGFGLMGLSAWYGDFPSDEERFAILDRAHELGETFWDSADIYQDSEDLVGKWFARTGKRNDIFLSTKFAFRWKEGELPTITGNAAYVKEACAKSLKRLGVDHIDLYYYHRVDTTVPIEETVGAMSELVKEGKVKYLALSSCSADTLRRAYAVHPIHAIQVEYSPFCLEIETPEIGILEACRELGVAIIAYCPLGRGMLTGVYTSPDDFQEGDMRKATPLLQAKNFETNYKLVQKISAIGKKRNVTPGQMSLAWIMAQGEDFIPIPGTKKIKYLEENLGSLDFTLTAEEVQEIRDLCNTREIAGSLDPDWVDNPSFQDTPPMKN
ncbi:hypothetical protein Q9L58_009604 [Maublancomyces gigas]|uniref:NADP-dependent oxidoreductase domain-containing protein n=1 Tax=Discina gigas TaxID=1032678 RepID=A0ABR3G6G4_9PEZI